MVAMLGLAMNQARRAEEYGLKFRAEHGGFLPGPPHSCPRRVNSIGVSTIGSISSGTSTSKHQSSDEMRNSCHHKRSSRRRKGSGSKKTGSSLSSSSWRKRSHQYLSLKCSMVGVGPDGMEDALGRVTIVNWNSQVVLDALVTVPVPVTDYRVAETGMCPSFLANCTPRSFDEVRRQVALMIKGKVLVGHGLEVDLMALALNHPHVDQRDTAAYKPLMVEVEEAGMKLRLPRDLPSLLVTELDRERCDDAITQAVGCLDLYKLRMVEWEEKLVKLAEEAQRRRQLMLSMRSGRSYVSSTSSVTSLPLTTIIEAGDDPGKENESVDAANTI